MSRVVESVRVSRAAGNVRREGCGDPYWSHLGIRQSWCIKAVLVNAQGDQQHRMIVLTFSYYNFPGLDADKRITAP